MGLVVTKCSNGCLYYANWFVACTSVSCVMLSWAILFLIKFSAACTIYTDYDPQFVINQNFVPIYNLLCNLGLIIVNKNLQTTNIL